MCSTLIWHFDILFRSHMAHVIMAWQGLQAHYFCCQSIVQKGKSERGSLSKKAPSWLVTLLVRFYLDGDRP